MAGRKFFWILPGVATRKSRLNIFFQYWELTLRNGDGVGDGLKESTGGSKEGIKQDLLSILGVGTESEERPQQVICYRVVDETGGLDIREKR